MALITGWDRGTWNQGAWNSPLSIALTGVSAATATGSVAVASETNLTLTGVSAATAVGTVEAQIGVTLTGVQAATAVGTPLLWQEIVPGQDADWDPITYTQAPNWAKIAA